MFNKATKAKYRKDMARYKSKCKPSYKNPRVQARDLAIVPPALPPAIYTGRSSVTSGLHRRRVAVAELCPFATNTAGLKSSNYAKICEKHSDKVIEETSCFRDKTQRPLTQQTRTFAQINAASGTPGLKRPRGYVPYPECDHVVEVRRRSTGSVSATPSHPS